MPRTSEENERIRKLAKENIRAAAMDVFIERGYHAASIEDVAKRAGISKGLMYNYYKGKEQLLAEVVRTRMEDIDRVMKEASALPEPSAQLKHIVDGALDGVKAKPKLYRFYLHLQTQPEEDHVLAKYSQMLNDEMAKQYEVQCEMFTKLGAENPRIRSIHFSSSLHGAMLLLSIYPDFPVQKIKEQIIEQFCS